MLSRRSVRIKAMQLLFSVNRDEQLGLEEAKKRYWNLVDDTFALYLSNLYVLIEIAKLSSGDLAKRKAKRLPTEQDKIFRDKLYNNNLIKNLEGNKVLQKKMAAIPITKSDLQGYYEKIYQEFSKTEGYIDYLSKDTDQSNDLEILLDLYRFCRKNELFNDLMEDLYGTWQDDKSVVVGAVKKTFKSLPETNDDFFLRFYPSDETVNEFGFQLLVKTMTGDETLLGYIEPTLKNWDSERLAIIDMILLKMATCELIGFPSIPTKVTINEYVDLAKNYSTAKSKEFINGVIDRIMKDFTDNGLIKKEGRGLG